MTQQAPSILLIGSSGSGKTHSLTTLLEAGLELFVVITEPHGLETLLDACSSKKLSLEKLHWKVVAPSRPGFDSMLLMAQKIAAFDAGTLAGLKPGTERKDAQWIELLKTLNDFVDERTGKSFGPVTSFNSSCAVAIDSLSGLNAMAMDITIGDKVTASPGEWGIAMRQLDKLILNLTSSLSALFVLTAHAEREIDENSGASRIMASALGRKLAPTLPRFFSEVVLASRKAESAKEEFTWSNSELNHDLKRRALALSSKLPPSFGPIVEAYKARLKLVEQNRKAS